MKPDSNSSFFAEDANVGEINDENDINEVGTGHESLVNLLLENSKLDDKNYRWQTKRTSVGNQNELGLGKNEKSRISLSKLMSVSKNSNAKKELRGFEKKKILFKPLKKTQVDKAARQVNFNEISKEIGKYDPIVKENRRADQLVFPSDQQKLVFNVSSQLEISDSTEMSASRPKTNIEKDVSRLINGNDNIEYDSRPLTENELAVLQATNIDNARAIHREIQRRRTLISYREAKFRRLRKIKSKQYHRLQKKDRIRKEVDEFEKAVTGDDADPDVALEKLNELNRLRALERASLKHHVTGKWAKYRKIRAKYDDQARDELNQQLSINQQLMKKRAIEFQFPSTYNEDAIRQDQLDEKEIDEDIVFANVDAEDTSVKKRNINLKLDDLITSNKNRNTEDVSDDEKDEDFDGIDFHNSEMQKYLHEAFMDDDVVQDFLREKKEKANAGREEQSQKSHLPGWGNWAGKGIVENRRKRKRREQRTKKIEKRLDSKIANAIILSDEARKIGEKFSIAYKPATIVDLEKFEKRCVKPIGTNWNPQTVFRSLTEPKVITAIGSIIEPMEPVTNNPKS